MSNNSFQINSPILRLERLDMLGSLENYLVINVYSLSKSRNFKNWINLNNNLFFFVLWSFIDVDVCKKFFQISH